MKFFADLYFNIGWIAITMMGIVIGYYAGKKRNWTMLAGWTIACVIISLAALAGRHL